MKQKGIALIQVLLLSTILTVMLLSMHHQARQHLKLAQAVRDYTFANMALQSAGAIGGKPGSPTPPGSSVESIM